MKPGHGEIDTGFTLFEFHLLWFVSSLTSVIWEVFPVLLSSIASWPSQTEIMHYSKCGTRIIINTLLLSTFLEFWWWDLLYCGNLGPPCGVNQLGKCTCLPHGLYIYKKTPCAVRKRNKVFLCAESDPQLVYISFDELLCAHI